jgi:PAS domain S-box-containing protein
LAVIMTVTTVVMYVMGLETLRRGRHVAQQLATLNLLADYLSLMKDADTGHRGFVLTGREEFLQPYHAAQSRLKADLDSLKRLAESGELNPDDIAEIQRYSDERLAIAERSIQLRRSEGFEPALNVILTGRGQAAMDALRQLFARMAAEERRHLVADQRTAERYTHYRTAVFIAAFAVNLSFLFWAYGRIVREQRGRDQALAEVQRKEELLRVTLASIGDAVIVTDTDARITFMNPVAEELAGWPLAEARGTRADTVFKIVNEHSRELVESPVDKVLRLGVIVGLANHTILIRKDGSEIPIDDSGAPVREADGNVRGVVLVFRDFSERKRHEKELTAAKEAAEAANLAKDNFLATLSHELRTPLTPVLATLGVWETASHVPASLVADVTTMRRNIELEARLIDDLLDLTRIAKGKLALHLENADVHRLIASVTEMCQSEIQAKRIQFSVQLRAESYHTRGDPARLQQVFWNIIKNATKFTPEGGRIEITTGDSPQGRMQIVFRDTGIGMTPKVMDRLFNAFEQGSVETARRYGGLGLGLAISKALLDAQDGSIAVESAGPGHGSTFTVTLPTADKPPRATSDTPAALARTAVESNLHILLVEDHVDTALALSRLLRGSGHRVRVADSVVTALRAIATDAFDVVVSDIGLPDGTGMDLIRQIRQQHGHKLRAVALTGFGMDDDIAQCRAAGFDDHLTKPVNLKVLEATIQRVTGSKGNAAPCD